MTEPSETATSPDIGLVLTARELDNFRQHLRDAQTQETAKEVASKSIGRFGLAYITAIVLIGVASSYFLTDSALTAVMTMIGAVLMALIQMLHGITGVAEKPERPEFAVIQTLIDNLNQLAEKPMMVNLDGEHVTIQRGAERIASVRPRQLQP